MPSLKCTRKLLKAISVQSTAQVEEAKPAPVLGDWCANLLTISRHKALLFTNESTLYSFAVLGIRKADLNKLASLFLEHLRLNLTLEDLPAYVIDKVMGECQNMVITRTDSRSVLGSMNDLASLLEHYVFDSGGVKSCDVREINKQLNRSPHKPLGWKFSAEVLQERLLGAFAVPGRPAGRVFLN